MLPENETTETTESEVDETSETTATTETTSESDLKTFDEKTVKGLRSEAADWRTKYRDEQNKNAELAKQVEEFRRAQLSEKERLELEYSDTKAENSVLKSTVRNSLLEAAVAKNVREFELADADATLRLMDQNSIEYGDDNRPVNIEEVLTATLERYPFLKLAPVESKKQVANTGATSPGKQRTTSLSKEAISRMSVAERTQRKDEISTWLANGYK